MRMPLQGDLPLAPCDEETKVKGIASLILMHTHTYTYTFLYGYLLKKQYASTDLELRSCVKVGRSGG